MATAASYFSGKKYGGIPSIPPGTTFPDRKALRASGVHAEVRAGIFAEKYRDGAYAVLLNGGYTDQDHGDLIEYVGQGGLDKPGGTQVASQKWDWRNKSLQQSYESRKPVRVVRGFKLDSPYAPEQGFRYDGLYSVTKVRRESLSSPRCVCGLPSHRPSLFLRANSRLPDQPPLLPPRIPTETLAHTHAAGVVDASGQPGADGNAQASSSCHAHAEVSEMVGSYMDTREVQQAARELEGDEVGSSSGTDSEEDDVRPDDASNSSGMSVDEDECPHRSHGALSYALAERSRLRPMPRADDEEEAEEELEVRGILETPVDEERESETASIRDLCAAMLEAAAMSEQASKSTRSRVVPRDASEANETSTSTGASPEPQSPSASSTREADNLTIAMAELKDSTALFDAAMRRLRDAERATSHAGASSLSTPSTRFTTESDFEDTLADAAAAAASAADLASLAIRRQS
ncbi:PUA-like domain-containing protein [Schizophyllum commune]